MSGKPCLLFVTPRYLIPADSGGKIRTSDILRGLKGGVFSVTLSSPTSTEPERDKAALADLCDRFAPWPEPRRGPWFPFLRLAHLAGSLPVSVVTDESLQGRRVVADELARRPDIVVIDFPHTAVLLPERLNATTVMFTHNVEAEIFHRHAEKANGRLHRLIWQDQVRKMRSFERGTLKLFDRVIAVSERDRAFFADAYGIANVVAIPTGVDLGYFSPRPPGRPQPDAKGGTIVFTGSMDWRANIEGIEYFMEEVWPLITQHRPQARFVLVGRNPPASLVETVKKRNLNWTITGFVDDVRPYIRDADVFVMPLRIGGGTRIKAFEAMAMGCPVVSTSLGVEGLPVEEGHHYWRGDNAGAFVAAVTGLLADPLKAEELAANARKLVETNFSASRVAAVFESICAEAMRERASKHKT